MSLYLQALARAAGAPFHDGPEPVTALPRPKSRFEDWPEGVPEEISASELGGTSFETEASRSNASELPVALSAQVGSDPLTKAAPLPAPPRAQPAEPALQAPVDTGTRPAQAPLAAIASAPAAPAVPAAKVEAALPAPPSARLAIDATIPASASVFAPLTPDAVAIPTSTLAVATPPASPLPPAIVVEARPSETGPAMAMDRPTALDVPSFSSASDRSDDRAPLPLIVEIGRVEIRLDAPTAPRPAALSRRGDDRPVLTLADYLSAQGPGARRP